MRGRVPDSTGPDPLSAARRAEVSRLQEEARKGSTELDWHTTASAAAAEMERHARALLDSANVLRDALGMPPLRIRAQRPPSIGIEGKRAT